MVEWMDGEELAADDAAIDAALANMYSMCGNSGQDSLITLGEPDFRDWAHDAFENYSTNTNPQNLILELQNDLPRQGYEGTHIIWQEGISEIQQELRQEIKEDEEDEREMDSEDRAEAMADEGAAEEEGYGEEEEGSLEEEIGAEFGEEEGLAEEAGGLFAEEDLGAIVLADAAEAAIIL